MAKALSAAILLSLLLAGCSSVRTGSLCSLGAFRPDPGAVTRWTTDEKRQLVTLNNSGAAICGWK